MIQWTMTLDYQISVQKKKDIYSIPLVHSLDIVLASLVLLLMLVFFCGSCFAFKVKTDLYDALAHNPSTLPIWNPKSLNMWNL